MIKYFLGLSLIVISIVACNNSTETREATNDSFGTADTMTSATPPTTDVTASTTTCYQDDSPQDSVLLQITKNGDAVSGSLFIQYAGKDRNNGTLTGAMKGDTLLADYTFNSEGKESVRQEIFLKKGDALIQGFGPVEEMDGKMVFTDLAKITFNEKMKLMEKPCQP